MFIPSQPFRFVTASCALSAVAALAAAPALASAADESVSTAADRQAMSVTIYNDALALVREERRVALNQGPNRIALREVSAQIMPETASLRALDSAALTLLEQNFDYDLLGSHSLLSKYVGKTVTVIHTNVATGEESRETATVLAYNDGVVLQYADRIETGVPSSARLAFDGVPASLRDRPTLVVSLDAPEAATRVLDLSYLTGGLGWKADYVATLSADETSLDLAGWVTLNNTSGASYENAQLQLVAGDVGRAPPEDLMRSMSATPTSVTLYAGEVSQEALFEYHLYKLQRPTTIADNQTKQVALLSANTVPVRKEYRLESAANGYYHFRDGGSSPELGQPRKVNVFVEFDNEDGGLGVPLPKGVVRVYKADSQARALFIGEDRIDHTAKEETVRLKLGSAFDLNGTWKHLETKKIADSVYEMAFAIELRNAKDVPATIKVVESIPGQWSILDESHPHSKPSSQQAQWEVEIEPEGRAELSYTVRINF